MCKRKLILFILFIMPSYLAADLPKQEIDTPALKQEINTSLGYAYVYNKKAVNMASHIPMPFDSNGPMTSGITHILGSSEVVLKNAGVYQVNFAGTAEILIQGAPMPEVVLYLNNQRVTEYVCTGNYSSYSIIFQAIIVANAGDILTIKLNGNPRSLNFTLGASIIIKQLA